jgi:nitrogen fixation/metabolism regulation signal transduction histidine kinase
MYSFVPLFFFLLNGLVFISLKGANVLLAFISIQLNSCKFFIHNSSGAILITNNKGKILKTNNKLSQIINLSYEPITGDYLVDYFTKYPQIIEKFNQCVTINKQVELLLNQNNIELVIKFSPVHLLKICSMLYFIEIQQQNLMSMSEKILSWSSAVQKMAHDIKTPLSTVTLNLKVLQKRLEKIKIPQKEYTEVSDDISMMRNELENIQSMTRNFLKFSNLEKPHFQVCDVLKLIESAKEKYKVYFTKELNYTISVAEEIKSVWADPQQIELVMHILLENALTALKGKGQISIDVCMAQYLDRSFHEYIEIEVADSGPGINEKDKIKVFEPYYTTKQEGTGMGLAIAKKIIEDHSGTIEVYSKINFGAVFRFSIPVFVEEGNNE